tara:strand:- start:57 stop:476 length:420 start_codon:yes stop_codon:yes gene_type:complete
MFTSQPYRIYIHETDVAGVVHHSNYLKFFEAGRIEFLRSIDEPYIDLQSSGYGFVPVTISINYKVPLRQDDEYVVTVELIELKKASFIINQTIRSNNQCVVDARIKLACVSEPEFKPKKIPEETWIKLKNNFIELSNVI